MELEELQETARESLRVHLESAGLSPRVEGDRVWIGLGDLWCRVTAGEAEPRPEMALVPFWFDLALVPDGSEAVTESLAGMGDTPAEAAVHAAHDWVETVLPPIRALLEPGYRDERVHELALASVDDESGEPTQWRMFAGPPLLMGPHADAVREALKKQPPVSLVLDELAGYLHLRERHWVKAFLCRFAGRTEGEVRIDNAEVPQALESLKRFAWPSSDDFMGFRQFLILEPIAAPAGPEPAPEPRRRPWWRFGR